MAKGGNFERKCARLISLWWTNGEDETVFYRSHASGARATSRAKSGKETEGQYGDLCAAKPIGKPLIDHWCEEFKTGYSKKNKNKQTVNWCAIDVLDGQFNKGKPMLITLWEDACFSAVQAGTKPLLIFQRPWKMPCIVLKWEHFCQIPGKRMLTKPFIKVRVGKLILVIFKLDDFFYLIPDPQRSMTV